MASRKNFPEKLLRRLHYTEKRSVLEVSKILGVDRNTVTRNMRDHGLKWRTASEASTNMYSKMTKKETMDRVANAHKAGKGRTQPLSERINRARTVEKSQKLSDLESVFYSVFIAEAIPLKPLLRVQRFNVDFGCRQFKLAVEVDGGNWHQSARKQLQDRTKTRYLEQRGWTIVRFRASDITTCTNKIVTVLKRLGWHPPPGRKKRVGRS